MTIEAGELLTVAEAAKAVPPRGVSCQTVWRWISKGVNARKLMTVPVAGRTYIRREDLAAFLHGPKVVTKGVEASPARKRRIAAAAAEVEALGI